MRIIFSIVHFLRKKALKIDPLPLLKIFRLIELLRVYKLSMKYIGHKPYITG